MIEAGGAGDIDAAMNRIDPCGAGIRHDDPASCPGSKGRQRSQACALSVRLAMSSPPGIEISTMTSPVASYSRAVSSIAALIIRRGTGLIAGSPGGSGRPARVTVPIPSPARNVTPDPGGPCETRAMTSAPCVTSGSSPASLMMPARANPSPSSSKASAKDGRAPPGRVMATDVGKRAAKQRLIGRAGGGGGAGAGRPAFAQSALSGAGFFSTSLIGQETPFRDFRGHDGPTSSTRPRHRRTALWQRQDDADAWPHALLPERGSCRRGRQMRAGLYRPRVSMPPRPADKVLISTVGRCLRRCSTQLASPLAGDACELILCEGLMGLFDGVPARAGPDRLHRRCRGGARLAGPARARRERAVANGGGDRPRLRQLRPAHQNRRGGVEPGRKPAPSTACQRRPSRRSDSRFWGPCRATKTSVCRNAISASCRPVKHAVSMRCSTGSRSLSVSMSIPAPFCLAPARLRCRITRRLSALPPPAQRIAIARDEAFSFLYPHILAGWRKAGAELTFFSPLANEPPPEDCDLCWLPGGYPELHAGQLAAAARFLDGLRRFAKTKPVHGECGGYMVLGQSLTDQAGHAHRMAGLLDASFSFAKRKLHLGYRQARLAAAHPLGPKAQCCAAMNFITPRSRRVPERSAFRFCS